jgi:hypothetical protein
MRKTLLITSAFLLSATTAQAQILGGGLGGTLGGIMHSPVSRSTDSIRSTSSSTAAARWTAAAATPRQAAAVKLSRFDFCCIERIDQPARGVVRRGRNLEHAIDVQTVAREIEVGEGAPDLDADDGRQAHHDPVRR